MLHVEQSRTPVTTADYQASSDRSFAPIQSLTEKEETSSEYFTRKTLDVSATVLPSGSPNIERGSRRLAWEAGIREGHSRAMQSQTLVSLCVQRKWLLAMVDCLAAVAKKQERMIEHLNKGRVEALKRVIELARKLDKIAPGWDK